MYRPLWIEIDLKNIKNNFQAVKKNTGAEIMATVKQDAYGHGLVNVAQALSSLGVDFFALGSLEEAAVLRDNRIDSRLLVLTSLLPELAERVIDFKVRPAVTDFDFARALDRAARKRNLIVPVHIKIDTGMGRVGIWHQDAEKEVEKIAGLKNLSLEGIFTHFPSADTDVSFTRHQIRVFNRLLSLLETKKIGFVYRHCANSAALARFREAHFNLVRPGLVLYGIHPYPRIDLPLKPVLSLKSKVVFVKTVFKGRSIGYGRTHVAGKNTEIVTIAAGYADGYPWSCAEKARVIIKDKPCKVRGRVCMDHIMAETGSLAVKKGEPVTLIGSGKKSRITAEDLAFWSGTIPYEIVTGLSSQIPRIYK